MAITEHDNDRKLVTQKHLLASSKAIYDKLNKSLDDKTVAMEMDIGSRMLKVLEERFEKAVDEHLNKALREAREVYNKELSLVKTEHQRQINFLKQSQKESLDRIEKLISALKIPHPEIVVNVPRQETPHVNVNVPKQDAPVINVPASIVEVNVPEQAAPVVNFNAPSRKTTKNIQYDDYGRPVKIEEE